MPLRAFWNLNAQVSRLRAEASLQQLDLFVIANSNSDPQGIQRLREALSERMGQPVKEDKARVVPAEQHSKGIEELRALRNQMREEG